MSLLRLSVFFTFILSVIIFVNPINGACQNKSPNTDLQKEKVAPATMSYGLTKGKVQTPYEGPVVNQNVYLLVIVGDTYSVFKSTSTDTEGRWVIKDVPPGYYSSWISDDPPNLTIGVGAKREVVAGKTTDFGTHEIILKDDSTPRDIAKRDATPYQVDSSALMTNGIYAYLDDNENWNYLRFYTDGTVRSFANNENPDKPTKWFKEWLKDYPYVGVWGQFTVDGTNILIETTEKSNVKISDKWECKILQQGKKLSFYREKRIADRTYKKNGTMSFYHDSNWNE